MKTKATQVLLAAVLVLSLFLPDALVLADNGGHDNPHFNVDPQQNSIWGHEWPPHAQVTITIGDHEGPDFDTTAAANERGDFGIHTGEFDIQAGHFVTVTDGVTTKTHTVTSLTIIEVNTETDTISGTAEPGSEIIVHIYDDDVFRTVGADPAGDWTADFSVAVGPGHEDQACNLRPGSHGNAHQRDAEDDATLVHWRVANPRFIVYPQPNYISGHDWEPHAEVTVIIGDSDTPEFEAISVVSDWGSLFVVTDEFEIQAGQLVTVTDGVNTKTHIVTSLTITEINIDKDTISGTAEAGSDVYLQIYHSEGHVERTVTADTEGNWTADFSEAVGEEPQNRACDLTPGTWGLAAQWDDDGDATFLQWYVPDPFIAVNPQDNVVWGSQWVADSLVTINIGDDPADPDWSDTSQADWSGRFTLHVDDYDIRAGDLVTVNDDVTTRTHVVTALTINEVNTDDDTVSGTAEPDSEVLVWVWKVEGRQRSVVTDSEGNWTADFSIEVGPDPWDGTYDIGPGAEVLALQYDDDGDATFIYWHVLNPHFAVSQRGNMVVGFEWPADAQVTVTIGNPADPDWADTAAADERGEFQLHVEDLDIRVGDLVTVTDGMTTKTHVVTSLEVTAVDADADTVSGTAEPGSAVHVLIWNGREPIRFAEADAEGNWLVDFSAAIGDEPWQQAYDIGPGTQIVALQLDEDGDSTFVYWHVLGIDTIQMPVGEVGVAYEATLEASGGTEPYSWAIVEGAPPPGLDLDGETGIIFGIPTEIGAFDFTVQITDDEGLTADKSLSITVRGDVIPGDANGDGVINVLDLAWAARIIAGLEANGDTYPGGDANQDGVVNVLDLAKIARIIAGLD